MALPRVTANPWAADQSPSSVPVTTGGAPMRQVDESRIAGVEGTIAGVEHIARRRPALGLDVRDFVVGNSDITEANAEAAINAAKAYAYENLDAYTFNLLIPVGSWPITAPLVFPGTGINTPTPGILGAGHSRTLLRAVGDFGSSAVIRTGSDGEGMDKFSYCQHIEGFTLAADSGAAIGSGIHSVSGFRQTIKRVRVVGFQQNQHWANGVGFKIVDHSQENNHQHLWMEDCAADICQLGFWFRNVWPSNLVNCHANQCTWLDVMLESLPGFSWHGGTFQGSDLPVQAASRWHGNRHDPRIVSGASYTTGMPHGAGATCGVASARTCVVTGLAGLTASDQWRWLELTDPSNPPFPDLVSGLYRIVEVIGPTSCRISKGSSHAAKGGLAWQVRGTQGAVSATISGYPYHEGNASSLVYFGPDEVTQSTLMIDAVIASNCDYVVEAHGVQGTIGIRRAEFASGSILATRTQSVSTDAPETLAKIDDFTRQGFVSSRANGGQFVGAYGHERHLRTFCVQRGAAEVWDAQVASKVTIASATNVSAWNGVIHGSVLSPQFAGRYPQYVDDAITGRKSIRCVGGAANMAGALRGTIAAQHLPSEPYASALVVIARLPDTTPIAAQQGRRVYVQDQGGGRQIQCIYNDACYIPSGTLTYVWGTENAGLSSAATFATDTKMHVIVVGQTCRQYQWMFTDSDEMQIAPAHDMGRHVPATALNVYVGGQIHATSDDLYVEFLAFFPRGLAPDEMRQIVDLARVRL